LVQSLQSFENACTNGLDMLDDETGAQASTTAPGKLVFTRSNQALLDDLDSLMDDEIGAAAPNTTGKPSPSQ
jgi:hypothetical protein